MLEPLEARNLEIRDRDLELLRGLLECRLITLGQAAEIYFGGAAEAAKKRIRKLKSAGFVGERERRANEKSLLFLTGEGYRLLCDRGMLQDLPSIGWAGLERRIQVSPLTIRHEIQVMDVKAAFSRACRTASALSIREFSTWPARHEFTTSPGTGPEQSVKPDGFIRIRQRECTELFEHLFFFELDRSSETLNTLVTKAMCYLHFYQSGGLAVRFGHTPVEYKDFPFRVLIVLKTAERRNNLAEALLTSLPPIYTQSWLTTFAEVTANPFGPIWIRPRDYLHTSEGSSFPLANPSSPRAYRRNGERERYVELTIAKHDLFKDI